jgi:inorganic pyrophosphatase
LLLLYPKKTDIGDVEKHMPGTLKETFTFLRDYKIPDGKGPNHFAFNNEAKDANFAMQVVREGHEEWKKLLSGATKSTITV